MNTASLGREAAEVLYRLLEAYSPSGEEGRAAEVFVEEAGRLGFDEVWIDEAGSPHARKGDGLVVALIGHIDTVPGRLPVSWRNGVLSGRGAVDAKGPLSAMLIAASHAPEDCGIQVSGLVGEEADSPGARLLAEQGFWAPNVIIGEPSGTTGVIIGYRGSSLVRIECIGAGGHSSSPEIGDSALDKLLGLLGRESLKGISKAIVELHATSPSRNVLPTRAEAYIDTRFDDAELLESWLEAVEEAGGCRAEALTMTRPVRVKPNDPVPRSLIRGLLLQGLRPRLLFKRGTSDMNLLYPCCAGSIAAYGPGDPSLSHTPWEKVSEKELGIAVKTLINALKRLCTQHNNSM